LRGVAAADACSMPMPELHWTNRDQKEWKSVLLLPEMPPRKARMAKVGYAET